MESRPSTPTPRKLHGATSATIPLIIRGNCKYDAKENRVVELSQARSQELKLVPEALDLLKTIKRNVAPIVICGPFRSGKSYFLSQLIGDPNAFQTGPTMHPCTLGIWMGTTVLDYKDFTIVLFDTEGIDAFCNSSGDESAILVLSILLSSYLIYNSMKVPTRSDLEKLTYFTQLSESIVVRASDTNEDMLDFRDYFPKFLWLLRDVSLKATDQSGTQLSPTEFLKSQVLRTRYVAAPDKADIVSTCIMNYFPSIECQFLPTPSADEMVLQKMEDSTLPREFTERREQIKQFIFQSVDLKRGFNSNTLVTGAMLAHLAEHYVQVINTPGSVIAIDQCWESAVESRLYALSDSLIGQYTGNMREKLNSLKLPIEESNGESEVHIEQSRVRSKTLMGSDSQQSKLSLMGIHKDIFEELYAKLMAEIECLMPPRMSEDIGAKELKKQKLLQQFERSIVQYEDGSAYKCIGGALYPFLQENRQRSHEQCEAILDELYYPIEQQIEETKQNTDSTYSYDDVLKDLESANEKYFDIYRPVGPAKEVVLKSKKDKILEHCNEVFKVVTTYGTKLREKTHEADVARTEAMEINRKLNRKQEELSVKEVELERLDANLETMKKQLEEDFNRRIELEHQKQEEFLTFNMKKAQEGSEAKIESLKSEYEEYKQSVEDQHKKESRKRAEEIRRHKQAMSELRKKDEEATQKGKDMGDTVHKLSKTVKEQKQEMDQNQQTTQQVMQDFQRQLEALQNETPSERTARERRSLDQRRQERQQAPPRQQQRHEQQRPAPDNEPPAEEKSSSRCLLL